MNSKNVSIASFLAAICIPIFFYSYSVIRKNGIEKNGVYVLAYIYTVDSDLEGVNYRFFYNYKGKKYFDSVGALDLKNQKSLITLKISTENPDQWIIEDKTLPRCLIDRPDLNRSWKFFPECK